MTTLARDAVLARIKEVVGPKGWTTDPHEVEPYLVEQRGLYRGATRMVVRPAATEEVAAVVRICAAAKLPIVPQGGNTGLVGGGVPPEDGDNIVLALQRMNRIRAIDPLNYTVTAEAGVVLADLQKAAEEAGRLFPLSLGAEGSCRIGGNLSTNAGGVGVLRYGNARDLALGLEVVLADGQVWDGLRGLRKDNTGYDLKQLFIGGEGTLGIITAACLKLFPRPREIETAFIALERIDDVMEVFSRARAASGDQLTAFELIPRIGLEFGIRHVPGILDPIARPYPFYALLEVSSSQPGSGLRAALEEFLAAAMEAGLVQDGVVAASAGQAKDLWRIREGVVEGQIPEGGSIKHDVSVPVSRVAEFVRRATAASEARLPGIRPVAFGHVGDGNIHFNLSQPPGADRAAFLARWHEFNEIVHGIAAALGGSISAEHGLGRLKRDEIARYKSPLELDLMRKMKRALDPDGIMNPGKVIPEPR
ncbi:MAG TPA: FAD-binding oxidoreductase [Stellaceae bacterium]|nr:FAD-binding oxidoreductase [Stellaceae bacterium]